MRFWVDVRMWLAHALLRRALIRCWLARGSPAWQQMRAAFRPAICAEQSV